MIMCIFYFIGITFSYFMQQLWIFWTMLISLIFWKLHFPTHFQQLSDSRKMKWVHIFFLLIGYLYPLVPAIAPIISFNVDVKQSFYRVQNVTFWSGGLGYQTLQFPPLYCAPIHYGIAYYTLIMPMNIMFPISGTLLIFVLRKIWKVCFSCFKL